MPAQMWPLSYAQQSDLSDSGIKVTVLSLAAVVTVAILSLMAMALARSRMPRASQGIMIASVVWGVLSAGSIIKAMLERMHWSSEQMLLLKTGYYDPTQASPPPAYPWWLWIPLICGYVIAVTCMLVVQRRRAAL